METKKSELSQCCGAEKYGHVTDEGTGFFACKNCRKEFIPTPISSEKEECKITGSKGGSFIKAVLDTIKSSTPKPVDKEEVGETKETSYCYPCKLELPITNFYKDKSRFSGISTKCKKCSSRLSDLRRKKNHAIRAPKEKARALVGYAVKKGKIIKLPCEVCGDVNSQGHHPDYSKPLEVVWLCQKHHAEIHSNPPLEVKEGWPEQISEDECQEIINNLFSFSGQTHEHLLKKQTNFLREIFVQERQKERERIIDKAWEYIVTATRAESWSKEDLIKAITNQSE